MLGFSARELPPESLSKGLQRAMPRLQIWQGERRAFLRRAARKAEGEDFSLAIEEHLAALTEEDHKLNSL